MKGKKSTKKNEEISNDNFKYEIMSHVGILSKSPSGWSKELNIVKWNDANPKFDIREWDVEHEKMSRGVSLNFVEAEVLGQLLQEIDFEEVMP